jgi:hypothetical protein
MMRFFIEYNCVPLKGELVYRAYEHSFDFKVESQPDLVHRAGSKGTTSLLIGTLQIEIGIETGAALFAWGLHSHITQWREDRLPTISSQKGCVNVLFDEEPTIGVSQGLAEVGEWQTTYDPSTGWISVSSNEREAADTYVEFADNTIAGLADKQLISLWLRPIWHRERFEEGPVSLFSEFTT